MNVLSQTWYQEKPDLSGILCPSVFPGDERTHVKRKFKKGEVIYSADDKPDRLFILESGRVKIGTFASNGKEILKAMISPGELFGELALFKVEKRNDFATAMENTEICVVMVKDVKHFVTTNPEFCFKLTLLLGNKLLKTERRLDSLLFKDARSRIVDYLKEQADEKGVPVGFETLIRDFNLTHQEIANLTGTSRQTVTTVLNELKDANLIYLNRRSLLIRDITALS